ncbi:SDR family NAD(P)-dependent oxidoreductase [Alkalibacillus sp. S2W]|uniref:SDR family NAD(P)-dependent oxidoreductase n=1 Tax=Alkalibacillus sp. S2W TaxID=3386553 RepID=UPI00398D09C4
MNILITGATGFLGTQLTQKLVNDHHHVYLLVRNQQKLEPLYQSLTDEQQELVHVVEGDLLQEELGITPEKKATLLGQIDALYHTAAYLSFDEAERDLVFDINLHGTKRALAFAKSIGIKTFIHVSTAYTLGEATTGYETLHPTDGAFVNTYEESKCFAEHEVMAEQDNLKTMIVRPAIIIGNSQSGEADTTFGLYGILRTVYLLKKRAQRKSDDHIFHLLIEEDTVSNLVPVDFVIGVLHASLTHGQAGTIYHATNPNPPTNGEIFTAIKEGMDFDQVKIVSYNEKDELSEEEQRLNQPLEVFKQYLNRSITFDRTNVTALLNQTNQKDLNMDHDMLLRIVDGFLEDL